MMTTVWIVVHGTAHEDTAYIFGVYNSPERALEHVSIEHPDWVKDEFEQSWSEGREMSYCQIEEHDVVKSQPDTEPYEVMTNCLNPNCPLSSNGHTYGSFGCIGWERVNS